jgi:integrase/recombinase XerD
LITDFYHFLYEAQPSTQTAAKHYRQLRRAFKIAKRWKLITENPLDEIDQPKPIQRKKDTFTPEEFSGLIDSLPTTTFAQRRFKRIVLIARFTGARASEVFNIRKDNILVEKEMLLVTNTDSFRTKSGKNRYIPLSRAAIKLVREQLKENSAHSNPYISHSQFLFPTEKGMPLSLFTISPLFRNVVRLLFPTKTNLCFHSLRATFITHAVDDGVPLAQIQMAVGHVTVRTTEGYINYDNIKLSHLKRSLNNISVEKHEILF